MANFAVLEDNLIINTIVADSKEIAESVTNKTCIEYFDEIAETGGTYINGVFNRAPRPEVIFE
jgi:hypothetical protein